MDNNFDQLIADTEKFLKTLDRSNKVESIACIFITVVFSGYTYLFRAGSIFVPIGSFLAVVGAIYLIIYIRKHRVRKGEIPAQDNLLEYFKYSLKWHQNTYELGRKIFWWYLLPFIPGFVFFIIGMMQNVPPEKSWFTLIFLGIMGTTVGGLVYWLNRYYSAKKLWVKIDNLKQ